MITSSGLCDVLLIYRFYSWTMNGGSWRLPIAVTFIYALKVLISLLYKMRYPEDALWDYPGFPSLLVQYGPTNDTHFTLQLGLMVAVCAEYAALCSKLSILSALAIAYHTVLILSLRGAYMIDVFAAYLFGHFFWLLGQ